MAMLKKNFTKSSVLILLGLILGTSCSSLRKPCAEAGDTSWSNPLKTDKACTQKKVGFTWKNHGLYQERDSKGRVILEGHFDQGLKTGTWIQYNEKGDPVVKKTFEKNIEVSTSNQRPENER